MPDDADKSTTNPVAEVIKRLKAGTWNTSQKEEQAYDLLGSYAAWLVSERLESGANNERTVNYKISWARKLLEVNFIPISKTLFKALVKSPRASEPDLTPIKKKTIIEILSAIADIRLRTYVLFLASTGWRATESLTMTIANLENFDIKTLQFIGAPFINASGRFAKTKKGKRRQLTSEVARVIEKLLAYNYRPRRIHYRLPEEGKYVNRNVSDLRPKLSDYLFRAYHSEVSAHYEKEKGGASNASSSLANIYHATSKKFRATTDRLGIRWEGDEENAASSSGLRKRRQVTLHTLRRFVYTQCKRVVDEGYAKYHIGRKTHEYDKSTDEEITQDFAAVEPALTFFDTTAVEEKQKSLEQQQIGLQVVVAQLRAEIQEMRAASIRSHENVQIFDYDDNSGRSTT